MHPMYEIWWRISFKLDRFPSQKNYENTTYQRPLVSYLDRNFMKNVCFNNFFVQFHVIDVEIWLLEKLLGKNALERSAMVFVSTNWISVIFYSKYLIHKMMFNAVQSFNAAEVKIWVSKKFWMKFNTSVTCLSNSTKTGRILWYRYRYWSHII